MGAKILHTVNTYGGDEGMPLDVVDRLELGALVVDVVQARPRREYRLRGTIIPKGTTSAMTMRETAIGVGKHFLTSAAREWGLTI